MIICEIILLYIQLLLNPTRHSAKMGIPEIAAPDKIFLRYCKDEEGK